MKLSNIAWCLIIAVVIIILIIILSVNYAGTADMNKNAITTSLIVIGIVILLLIGGSYFLVDHIYGDFDTPKFSYRTSSSMYESRIYINCGFYEHTFHMDKDAEVITSTDNIIILNNGDIYSDGSTLEAAKALCEEYKIKPSKYINCNRSCPNITPLGEIKPYTPKKNPSSHSSTEVPQRYVISDEVKEMLSGVVTETNIETY